jgi:hypothetical protein
MIASGAVDPAARAPAADSALRAAVDSGAADPVIPTEEGSLMLEGAGLGGAAPHAVNAKIKVIKNHNRKFFTDASLRRSSSAQNIPNLSDKPLSSY